MTTIQDIFNQNIGNSQFLTNILEEKLEKYKSDEIEIESRLGIILQKFKNERLPYNTFHSVILKKSPHYEFKTGVEKQDFEDFQNLFIDEKSFHTSGISLIHGKVRRIICDNSDIMVKKTKIEVFDIFLPNCSYDMRISVSKKQKMSQVNQKGSFKRKRKQDSYTINALQFDLTTIIPFSENLNKEQNSDPQYVIETEMVGSDSDLETFIRTSYNLAFLPRLKKENKDF